MISKFLKGNQPLVLVFILVIGFGFWFHSFKDPIGMAFPDDNFPMPLAKLLYSMLGKHTFGANVIAFILVMVQGLLLILFNKRYIIINQRTFLPAFFYVLIVSAFAPIQRISSVIIGLFFIYLAVFYIFSIYRKDFALNKLYFASLFISFGTLFWAPYALFFIVLLVSLILLRPFVGREWIVSLIGFLTPFFFVFVYYFVFKEIELNSFVETVNYNFVLVKEFKFLHFAYYIFYGIIVCLIVIASFTILNNYQKKKIMVRKFFTLNWWFFIIYLIAFVMLRNMSYEIVYVISMPISFLLADYFYMNKNERFLNISVVLLLLSAAYIQIIAHY